MNKEKIIENVLKKSKYTEEQRRIIKALEIAKNEWQTSWEYFNQVKDPKLIDYAIYAQEASKAKYMYLLNEAKKNNIKINTCLLIQNCKIM